MIFGRRPEDGEHAVQGALEQDAAMRRYVTKASSSITEFQQAKAKAWT
jgi:hypothetical protein